MSSDFFDITAFEANPSPSNPRTRPCTLRPAFPLAFHTHTDDKHEMTNILFKQLALIVTFTSFMILLEKLLMLKLLLMLNFAAEAAVIHEIAF